MTNQRVDHAARLDTDLEQQIDAAGRERVFAIVRAAGWSAVDSVPKFVWYEAVRMCRQRTAENWPPLRVSEARALGLTED